MCYWIRNRTNPTSTYWIQESENIIKHRKFTELNIKAIFYHSFWLLRNCLGVVGNEADIIWPGISKPNQNYIRPHKHPNSCTHQFIGSSPTPILQSPTQTNSFYYRILSSYIIQYFLSLIRANFRSFLAEFSAWIVMETWKWSIQNLQDLFRQEANFSSCGLRLYAHWMNILHTCQWFDPEDLPVIETE